MSITNEYHRTSYVITIGLTAGLLLGCGSQTPTSNNVDAPADTDTADTDTNTDPVDEVSDDTTDEPSSEIEPVSNGNMLNQLTIDEDITGQAAPGIFGTGDIDNDGDLDVAVSGDGDPRVFWIEQQAPGVFETHVIAEELGQAGGMIVEDLDQDGNAEVIVTSYDQNLLNLFQHTMP